MKRLVIILTLILFSCLVAAYFVVTNPGLQKSFVLGVLSEEGEQAELVHLKVDPTHVGIEGLSYLKEGTRIEMGELVLDYSLSSMLFGKHIDVESLSIKDLKIDMRGSKISSVDSVQAEESGGSGKEFEFDGLFKDLREQGLKLSLGTIDIEGELVLPDGERMWIKMDGGGLSQNTEGEIRFTLYSQDGLNGSSEVEGKGVLTLGVDKDSHLQSIKFSFLLDRYDLKINTELLQEESGKGERYETTVNSLSAGSPVLFHGVSSYNYEAHLLKGSYDLSLTQVQLAQLVLGTPLPDFSLQGSGNYDLRIQDDEGDAEMKYSIRLPTPGQIDPSLVTLGEIALEGKVHAGLSKGALMLKAIDAHLLSGNQGLRLADVELNQPFMFPAGGTVDLSMIPVGKLLKLHFDFPVALLDPFVKDVDLKAGEFRGDIVLEASEKGMFKLSSEQLELSGLTVSQQDKLLLKDLGLTVHPVFHYNGTSFEVSLTDLNFHSQGVLIGQGSVQTGGAMVDGAWVMDAVKGQQTVNLQGLRSQPLFASKLMTLPASVSSFEASYQLQQKPEGMEFQKLKLQVINQDRSTLFDTELLQAFVVVLKDGLPDLAAYSGDLVRVQCHEFPLSLLSLFLSDGSVSGTVNRASVIVSARDSQMELRTTESVKVSELNLVLADAAVLDRVNLTSDFNVGLGVELIDINNVSINAISRGRELLRGDFQTRYRLSDGSLSGGKVNLQLELASLLQQPGLMKFNNVRSGTAGIQFSSEAGKNGLAEADFKIKNLVTESDSGIIKLVDLSYRGALDPEKVNGKLSLLVQGLSQQSDLQADLQYQDGTYSYDAKSASLNADDIQVLASAFSNPKIKTADIAQPTESSSHTATSAFWPAVTGGGELTIGRVIWGRQLLDQIAMKQDMSASLFNIEYLRGNYFGAPFELSGGFAFQIEQGIPYAFNSSLAITDLPMGEAFDISNWVDGFYSMDGKLNGSGQNLEVMFEQLMGQVSLKSTEGELTFFNLKDKMADSSLGAIGGLFGSMVEGVGSGVSLLKQFIPGQNLDRFTFISDLMTYFQSIKFYQFEIILSRGEDLDLVLNNVQVKSPESMLAGEGRVTHIEGINIIDQPLNLNLTLGTKGTISTKLQQLGVRSGDPDKDGYSTAYAFPITGTLRKPDTSKITEPIIDLGNNLISQFTGGLASPSNLFKILGNTNKEDKAPGNTGNEEKKDIKKEVINNLLKGFF